MTRARAEPLALGLGPVVQGVPGLDPIPCSEGGLGSGRVGLRVREGWAQGRGGVGSGRGRVRAG